MTQSINIKNILKNPVQIIESHFEGEITTANRDELLSNIQQLQQLQSSIQQLHDEKRAVSARFKNVQGESEATQLKQRMQAISSALKNKEAMAKPFERAILDRFSSSPSTISTNNNSDLPAWLSFKPLSRELTETIQSPVAIEEARPADMERWNHYVENHPATCQYHCYEWRNIIEATFGHTTHYLIALDQAQKVRGILPITILDSKLFGTYAVSLPFFNYGGPVADSAQIEHQLLEKASTIAQNAGCSHLEVRATRKLNSWPCSSRKVSMVRQLPDSKEKFLASLRSKLRSQLKRSRGEGLTIRFGHVELLDDFYQVFSVNMRDLGTPVYSKKLFKNILEQTNSEAFLAVVCSANKPVATALLIGYRDTLEIPWASTLKQYNRINANMFLYDQLIGEAIERQYKYFDFGRSSLDAGTYKFKKQWGAMPVPLHWHYWLAEGQQLPEINPDNPKYRLAIQCWQHMPVWLSKILGPLIVRNLP